MRSSSRPLRVVAALVWRAGPGLVVAQVVAAVLTGALPVAIAWLTKLLIDRLGGAPGPSVTLVAVLLAVAGGAAALLPHLVRFAQAEQARGIARHTTRELFTAVCRMRGLARLEDPEFHDRLRLAHTAGQTTPQVVADTGLALLRDGVTIAGLLGALATFSPALAAVVACAAVPELVVQLRLGRRRVATQWEIAPHERRRVFYQTLLTDQRAAKEIRLFGVGGFLRDRMLDEIDTAQRAERRLDVLTVRHTGLLTLLGAVVAGVALIMMVARIAAGESSLGDLAVLTAAVTGTQSALSGLVIQLAQVNEALALAGHYAHVVTAGPDLPEPAAGGAVARLRRAVELRDVWFRYGPGHPWVLRGVDLTIPHGRCTALVGLNGAGKSTVVKLLCRLYDPERGSVRWDGADLRRLRVDELRRRIGAVFQDHMAYDLTAAENIAIGDIEARHDLGRLRAAARWAGIDDTIAGLPHGYDTMLSRLFAAGPGGEQPGLGVPLSGGQWQRLALARAILRAGQADLLILDEPGSGLDPEAEHAVHERLRALRAGRTSLLISHRLNTVRGADHIVVLAGGRVAEQGTHDELMALGGEYARLFAMQAEGFRDAPGSPAAARP